MHRDVSVVAPTTPLGELLEPLERHGAVFVGDRDAIIQTSKMFSLLVCTAALAPGVSAILGAGLTGFTDQTMRDTVSSDAGGL